MSHPIRTFDYGRLGRAKLIQLIHVKANALGLSSDIRKELQLKMTGKESCADMNTRQLGQVCQHLGTLAKDAGLATPRRKGRPGRDERQPEETVTREQLDAIEHLFADIDVRPSGLMMNLCRRACGKPWAQTRADGNRIIEMLKSMRERNWRPTKEPERHRGGYAGAEQE